MAIKLVVQRATQEQLLPEDRELQRWAEAVLNREVPGYEVIMRLVDEAEARQLNSSYRNRETATNVLSFPSALPEEIQSQLEAETGYRQLGDLVVCASLVNREASEQGKAVSDHWAHLVIHGILHLLGHDHQRADQASAMEQLEKEILNSLGIADPYAPR